MIHEQLLKATKQLLKYDHIHRISENRHLSFKSQKDLWVKIWSMNRKVKSGRKFNFDVDNFNSCN